MSDLWNAVQGVFDQLNPMSTPNLIIFFTWLIIYLFTAMAIWRSERRWVRFVCFLTNQIFSMGFLISVKDVVVPALTLWVESLCVALATIVLSAWLFRSRKAEGGGPFVPATPSAQGGETLIGGPGGTGNGEPKFGRPRTPTD